MQIKNVLIIGLGLIGGSLAKAFKNRLNFNISAYDTNESYIKQALAEGIVSKFIDIYNENLTEYDLIVLCTPTELTCKIINKIYPSISKNTIVTDVCSTKGNIFKNIQNHTPDINFVGGHPMTGSEKSGYVSSTEHLFENAYYVITPYKNEEVADYIKNIVEAIGAIPIVMDYETHDLVTASISHMPHVIAFSLVNLIKNLDQKLEPDRLYMKTLAAGGFKDLTRIASSNALMWENICNANKENLVKLLMRFSEELKYISELIENSNTENILEYFNSAKKYRDSLNNKNIGIIKPIYRIELDVTDSVGAIAKVTSILAQNKINIKNINIENSREHEGGCLFIYFDNEDHYNIAKVLLNNFNENS